MSKNTVKPALTRKRDKRVVENYEYDKFTRRILAAYAHAYALWAAGSTARDADDVRAASS